MVASPANSVTFPSLSPVSYRETLLAGKPIDSMCSRSSRATGDIAPKMATRSPEPGSAGMIASGRTSGGRSVAQRIEARLSTPAGHKPREEVDERRDEKDDLWVRGD